LFDKIGLFNDHLLKEDLQVKSVWGQEWQREKGRARKTDNRVRDGV
jgi:hypothetical protein